MTDSINERIAKVKELKVTAVYQDGAVRTKAGKRIGEEYNWQHSIADAWVLVEEMARTESVTVALFPSGPEDEKAAVYVQATEGLAPTAPEAICLAYLALNEKKT